MLLDRERCVLCARCTRFSEQIAGDPFIALIERGALQQVGIYEKEPYRLQLLRQHHPDLPGRRADLGGVPLPRPALRPGLHAVGRRARLVAARAIRVDHRRGKVCAGSPRDDPQVNEEWISDKDRFAFHYADQADRITHPMVRDDATGELRPASWPEAFVVAARGLQAAGAPACSPAAG